MSEIRRCLLKSPDYRYIDDLVAEGEKSGIYTMIGKVYGLDFDAFFWLYKSVYSMFLKYPDLHESLLPFLG